MSATYLHELRTRARRLVDEGRLDEAMRGYVVAADHADAIGVRVEGEQLRARARQVVVYVWARARGLDVSFDDVTPVYVPANGLPIGPTRRFIVRAVDGDELMVLVDPADRVRVSPRRRAR